jgi:lysozyme
MKKAGLTRGAYHFYVTEDDPKAQADFFIKNVTPQPGDLIPAVDIESIGRGTRPGVTQRLKKFLDILENHYGAKPIIYTSPKFWNKHLNSHFGTYPLWIAEYGAKEPITPRGWKEWHLWQWKENAAVPGVEKGADLSIFNRKEKIFSHLLLKRII